MTGERLLVLGSNSFSGAHLLDHALEQGLEVAGISRRAEPHPAFLPYRRHTGAPLHLHTLDLNRDLDRIMSVVREFRPHYVVNFAAQGMVAESWQHPEQWLQTNLVSAVRLHEQLRGCDFLERFVQISTPEVYGNCTRRVTEDAPYNPSTPYAVSKAACDMSLRTFHQHYGFPVVTTRAANVYGPCQQLYRIIPRTILCVRQGRKLPLHGGGRAVRSFIHIRDVAAATLLLARRGTPGEVYHLATERHLSIRELVALVCRRLGVAVEDHVAIADDRPGTDAAYHLDSGKVRRAFGWCERVDLEAGIDETIAWVDAHLPLLSTLPHEYIHRP